MAAWKRAYQAGQGGGERLPALGNLKQLSNLTHSSAHTRRDEHHIYLLRRLTRLDFLELLLGGIGLDDNGLEAHIQIRDALN